jgi:septal ring factor EnvC (AmiA/AmiB activator)
MTIQMGARDAANQAKAARLQLQTVIGQINTQIVNNNATLATLRQQEQQLRQQISYLEAEAGTALTS